MKMAVVSYPNPFLRKRMKALISTRVGAYLGVDKWGEA